MSNNDIDFAKQLNNNFKDLKLTLLSIKQVLKDLGQESGKQSDDFDNLSKKVKGVGGAFGAAKHSMALFGIESKSLKEVESKIKSMIEVVGGLQTTFKTLGKTWGWITVIAAAVTGLVAWFKELNKEQNVHKDINKQANKSIQEEVVHIRNLENVLSNSNNSQDVRKRALDELKKIMPSYNAMLDKEGNLIKDNTGALNTYIEQIKNTAKAKIAAEKLVVAENEFIDWGSGLSDRDKNIIREGDEIKSLSERFGGDEMMIRETYPDYKQNEFAYKALSAQRDEKTKKIEELEKILEESTAKSLILNTESSGNSSKPANDIGKELLALQAENERKRIALLEEGAEKECEIINNTYQEELAKINEREAKWREAQNGKLNPDQEESLLTARNLANDDRNKSEDELHNKRIEEIDKQIKDEEDTLKALLEKYQDYADQRKAIEEKFTKDIDALKKEREKAEKEGNTENIKQYDGKIAQATQNKGKELMTHDFNALKENPDFTWAFDNIKSTSTDTLNVLLEQLNAIKDSNKEIDATKLKEYSGTIQQIVDELATRNPVAALANAQNQLTQANTRLAKAKQELDKANKSDDKDAKAKATAEHAAALIEVDKANKDVAKSQKVVNEKMGELFKNLSGVGEAIGGQAGQIISLIGDIGSFVTTSISGIEKAGQAGAGALAAVEKASAILAIIQLVIQLMSKISSIMSDTHQQYEKYAKKLAEINKLRDAVNEYQLAVLKAKQAEDNWFGDDNLQSLKDAKVVNSKVKETYDAKVEEKQAKYENKKGGGWLTNTAKWLGDAYQNTFGKIYDITVRKPSEFLLGKAGKFIATTGEAASFGLGTQASLGKYKENEVSAIDNLRIETRKAKSGFLGSGIGGRSQKTEDLRTWARNNGLGELFDEDNMINKQAAQTILDKYGDKLVGETKETLETLVDLREQYEEYQQQLRDYVSSLYEPLVGNFVDSLWAWFDEGKDALTSFKEMASGTFRDIVSDMMKTIVLEKIVGSYSDDIVDMYNEYAEGKLTEEELMDKVAQRTDEMIDTYEEQIPALQNVITTLGNSLSEAGIDIQKKQEEKEQTAEKGSFQTMSQETGSELLGQFTAIRIHTSNIYGLMDGMEKEGKLINNSLTAIEKNTFNTVSELKEVNNKLKQIKVEGIKVL